MTHVTVTQPDVTLLLDLDGVIREATCSSSVSDESVQEWLGRPWMETVGDITGGRVRRIVDDACTNGISAFRQITQRFPSGLELPMEYTTVLLGGRAGLLAIGKNLQAVAELQSRLIAAQQAMERDYWRIRDIETRYRMLFDASNEAVVVVKATSLRILEANPAALQALGLAADARDGGGGRDLMQQLAPADHEPFRAMLVSVRENGKAPVMRVHLGPGARPWLLQATLVVSEPGPLFMLRLTPADLPSLGFMREEPVAIDGLIERVPDGVVVVDREGAIRYCNLAFLDLIQVGSKNAVVGERLARWLWRPGADTDALLSNVMRHRAVRLFSTTIHGELGTDSDVEVSAAADCDDDPACFGIIVRDVTRRLRGSDGEDRLRSALSNVNEQIGRTSLRQLVKTTVSVVEQHYVKAALDLAGGNRTSAAEILGLSRQSLYAKLNRYGFDGGAEKTADPAGE